MEDLSQIHTHTHKEVDWWLHLPSVLTQADTEIECHCKVSYYTHIVCPSTGAKVDSVENGKILERNREREREREREKLVTACFTYAEWGQFDLC